MCVTRRADVDEIDVVAAEQLTRVGRGHRNVELARGLACAIDLHVGDGDDGATRIATIAGQMRAARPRAGAQHAHTDNRVARHGPPTAFFTCV